MAGKENELQRTSARSQMPTVAQVLARVLVRRAIEGGQQAIDAVLDRIEGKPTRAAQNKPTNQNLNDQIDAAISDLDTFAKE